MEREATTYTPPVAQLLTLGECRIREWPNYLELGLSQEHVPELIRMATDPALNWGDPDSSDVWAPVHAWRALGQLRATPAIEPLLPLLEELDDSDWAAEELPEVYGMIGKAAIPALRDYLADTANEMWPRITAAHALERIAAHHPEARAECVAVLTQQLEHFATQDPSFNASLIGFLLDLKAVEAAPLMERAFAAERVDLMVQGDWEDVQIELGLKQERDTPRPRLTPFGFLDQPAAAPDRAKRKSKDTAAAKAKAKRKQAKASRRKNRGK